MRALPMTAKRCRSAHAAHLLSPQGHPCEASYEDRQALDATLKQLNQVQEELMMQVLKK